MYREGHRHHHWPAGVLRELKRLNEAGQGRVARNTSMAAARGGAACPGDRAGCDWRVEALD